MTCTYSFKQENYNFSMFLLRHRYYIISTSISCYFNVFLHIIIFAIIKRNMNKKLIGRHK